MKSDVERVVLLPDTLFRNSQLSMERELARIGYETVMKVILRGELLDAIHRKPEVVEMWRRWSDDKRVSEGWYFVERGPGHYEVGYYSTGKGYEKVEKHADVYEACASYIVHELSR